MARFPFAWYVASYGGAAGHQTSVVTVSDPQVQVSAQALTITVAETTPTWATGPNQGAAKALLLSKYASSPSDSLTTYYLDRQQIPHELASYSDYGVLYKEYNVVLNQVTDAEQLAAIRGKTLTIKADALKNDGTKNPWETGYTNTPTDAIIQLVASNGSLTGYVANNTAASVTGVAYSVPGNFNGGTAEGTVIAKIAVRVDGDEALTESDQDDANAQDVTTSKDASFYVSVSAPQDQ